MALNYGTSSVYQDDRLQHIGNPILDPIRQFWSTDSFALVPAIFLIYNILAPTYSPILIAFAAVISFLNLRQSIEFPAFTPKSSNERFDPYNKMAGTEGEVNTPEGITCLGIDRRTRRQIWLTSEFEKRHFAKIATTGSGKTFGLRFEILMALIQTTGVIVVDGKGDETFPIDVWHLLRRFGREQDFRFLSFKQGGTDIYEQNHNIRTHTFNPLAQNSSSGISEILKALTSSKDGGGEGGDVWQQRANSMTDTISKVVAYMRDHFGDKVTPGVIREYLSLRRLCEIYVDERIPKRFKQGLKTYFETLPGELLVNVFQFVEGTKEFEQKTTEQHAYVTMQLQPALNVLADDYGYIFDTATPDIDMEDICNNNRILFVLLPALEKSEATTANTGKIILAALKSMIATQLGDGIEGNIRQKKMQRAYRDPAPFPVKLDESGYYAAVQGVEILPAQGRGLGFAFYFIAQTFIDWTKNNAITADIMWDNFNSKTIGRLTSEKTYEKVSALLGERLVLEQTSVELETNLFGGLSRRMPSQLQFVRRPMLEMKDFTDLREGEFYQIFGDRPVSMRVGDPQIKTSSGELRLPQFCALADIREGVKNALKFDNTKIVEQLSDCYLGKGISSRPLKIKGSLEEVIFKMKINSSFSNKSNTIADWQIILNSLAVAKDIEIDNKTINIQEEVAKQFKKVATKPKKQKELKNESVTDLKETSGWLEANDIDSQLDMEFSDDISHKQAVDKWTNYDPSLKVSPNEDQRDETADIFTFLNNNKNTEDESGDDNGDNNSIADVNEMLIPSKISLDKEGVGDDSPPPSFVLENSPSQLEDCAIDYPPPNKIIKKDKISKTVEEILAEINSIAPNIGI
jgi:hypothetical protein